MATYNFSALSNGQAISFNPNSDVLNFDQTAISAGNLSVDLQGSDSRITVLNGTDAGKSITLLNTAPPQLATSNVHFANASALLFGDNSPSTAGDDLANSIDGTAGADLIQGFGGNDFLLGGAGADRVLGGAGNDTVGGNDGNDWVEGGAGNDTVSGGSGQDSFAFHEFGAANADVLNDFAGNWDNIQLDAAAFTQIGATGRFASGDVRFYAAPGATGGHDADDRVVYNTSTGQLFYDDDGSGPDATQLIATLSGAPTLSATDINVFGTATPTPTPTPTPSGNVINGTAGNDSLVGTSGPDSISGFGGDDTIDGLAGNDTLDGGDGNDNIVGREGLDLLIGGAGNDTLDGIAKTSGGGIEQEADTLPGGLGDDVYWVSVTDIIVADPGGVDTVHGVDTSWTLADGLDNLILGESPSGGGAQNGTGNALDNLIDASGIEGAGSILSGLGGNDTLIGSQKGGTLLGGDGNDVLRGILFNAHGYVMDGGAGNDTLTGSGEGDIYVFDVQPGATNADLITAFVNADKIDLDESAMGTLGAPGAFSSGDPRFYAAAGASGGHDADDRIVYDTTSGNLWYDADGNGAGSAQLIATLQGAPTTLSDTDITVINGGASGSTINGTSGNDSLVGGPGNDTINGFGGNDTIDGGRGADSMVGGPGDDVYFVDSPSDVIVEQQSEGIDEVRTTVGYNLPAFVNNLTLLASAGGANGIGNDIENLITGNSSANQLFGGDANDTLIGGGGNDRLTGGAGNDSFIFNVAPGSANSAVIADFASGADMIRLDENAMSALGASGTFASGDVRFYAAPGANGGHDADDRVVYNTTTGQLWYDADGNGPTTAQLIATLGAATTLVATDIAVDNGTTPSPTPTPPPPGSIVGTDGNDTITGTTDNDTIYALG